MKTMKNLFILGLTVTFALSSCNKDDNNGGGLGSDIPGYTDKSTEDIKTDLEQDGQALMSELENFSKEPAVEVLLSMSSLTTTSTTYQKENPSIVSKSLAAISVGQEGQVKNQLTSSLKSFTETDPLIMDEFNNAAGTYDWNSDMNDWDYTDSPSDAIIYNFPGDTNTTTNNATLTIDNVTTEMVSDPIWDEETAESSELPGDMLTSANVTLEYEGSTVSTLTYSASIQSNGLPTNVTLALEIGDYTFSTELNHTQNKNLSLTYNISNTTQTIFELYGEVSGDWSEENIENNTETVEEEYDGYTYEYEEMHWEEIVRSGNAHYQVMNTKLVGAVNFKKLGDKIWEIEENAASEGEYSEETMEELVQAVNNNMVLALIYADGSGKIADARMDLKEYVDEYCYEDWSTGDEICEESEPYMAPAVYFVFSDDSEVDAEVYFSEVFDESINEFNQLMAELEEQYN